VPVASATGLTGAQAALAQRLLDALPQTQCTRCGYPDCAAYANAIASGQAAINQCPPGGAQGVARLTAITGHAMQPLNPEFGVEGPRSVAYVDENWCIGCTLCLDACPTDAIIGSNKRMHTVIEAHCTGCELCIPVCPVDCIVLEPASDSRSGWAAWSPAQADSARSRYADRQVRLEQSAQEHAQQQQTKLQAKLADLSAQSQLTDLDVLDKKRSIIEAALARARSSAGTGKGKNA
jgi:Na+-translocating ferredoxin:NAD+ oxidoreductase subunit B